jgi:hypothetical protein
MNVLDWKIVYGPDHIKIAKKLLTFLNRWSIWPNCWTIDEEYSDSRFTMLIAIKPEPETKTMPQEPNQTPIPNEDHEKLPLNSIVADWTDVPKEIQDWIKACPVECLFKNEGFNQRFRIGKQYDIDGIKSFNRIRISIDVSPIEPFKNQD